MRAMLLGVVMVVAGCGTLVWSKNGDMSVDSSKDAAQCEYETNAAVASIRDSVAAGMRQNELMRMCMRVRGYEQTIVRD